MKVQKSILWVVMGRNSIRFKCATWLVGLAFLVLAAPPASSQISVMSNPTDATFLESAVRMTLGPSNKVAQFNYIMTGRINLLLFWKGADDVGGGYIRRGVNLSDPSVRLIQVLFGSDPAKAPRGINNWGAATEAITGQSNAFFGFMKSTDSESVNDAQADIQRQKELGKYAFRAIVAFVDEGRALSRSIPLHSNVDFNLHQFEQAQKLVVGRLTEDPTVRRLDKTQRPCAASRAFLEAVDQLIDRALAAGKAPSSLCYVYNARIYTITLTHRRLEASRNIQVKRKDGTTLNATYRKLMHAEFSVLNHKSEESNFELLLGTDGALKGVPIQIVYQPNFWFQVELNLDNAVASQGLTR